MRLIKINPEQYHILDDRGLITHSTVLTNPPVASVAYLDLSEVKELIGEVDVEKKAKKWLLSKGLKESSIAFTHFVSGYDAALEDNKDRKYTEAELRGAYQYAKLGAWNEALLGQEASDFLNIDEYVDFVNSTRTKTEWNVEIVDGKLKLV